MTTMDLEISVGEDFYAKLFIRTGANKSPKDLTNATIFGGIKTLYNDTERVLDFDVEYISPRTNGLVAIKSPRSKILRLQQFSTRPADKTGKFFYDVYMKEGEAVKRILGGALTATFSA